MEILTRAAALKIPRVRLVGGETTEIVTIDTALKLASEQSLDLILISDTSDPPVVKIQNFKKLIFDKKKEKQKQRQKSIVHQPEMKEIQLKPNITDHDLGTKVAAMKRFLDRGDKVKLNLKLKGREREVMKDKADILVKKVVEALHCKAAYAGPGVTILEQTT